MSKAFTKESDDEPEIPLAPRPSASLPLGAKNYVTPDGAGRMRAALSLMQTDRAQLASQGGEPETKRRLQHLDQRIAQLLEGLKTAEVTPPSEDCAGSVCFGATVIVRDGRGEESVYRIVGVDEADPDRGWVCWLSPIARALMNAKIGQRVCFKFPSGETELEIVGIQY
jgi:transcription elongation factor GreB